MSDKITQYPLYNNKNVLIGTCELDGVTPESDGTYSIYCFDTEGNEYTQDAGNIERVLNFCDPTMPSMYGREL